MRRLLIVNGDDAGVDAGRDAAILEAADRGVLRSASLVANGATLEAFLAQARRRAGLSLGLHLNLTSGRPLGGRAFTLLEADGGFCGRKEAFWRRAVDGTVDPREVEREAVAQWRRLEALGVAPDHVDGHQHVHVLPPVADGLLAALAFLQARVFVRLPAEGMPPPGWGPVTQPAIPFGTTVLSAARLAQVRAGHVGVAALGAYADAMRPLLRRGLRAVGGFTGVAFGQAPSVEGLRACVAAAPGDVVEAMVHPGRMASGGDHSTDPRRDLERAVLLDPALVAGLAADGVEIGSFRDVAP